MAAARVRNEYGHLEVLINNAGTAAPRLGAEELTTDTEALVRRACHTAEPRGDRADGARLDIPTAGFWFVRDGKIREFSCISGWPPCSRSRALVEAERCW